LLRKIYRVGIGRYSKFSEGKFIMKRLLFVVLTGLLTALFLVTMWEDTTREWTHYQRQFMNTLKKDEQRRLTGGIKQIIVSGLRKVDRCTTCHLVIDQPQLALGAEPFKEHPAFLSVTEPLNPSKSEVAFDEHGNPVVDAQGNPTPAPFKWHPVEKFGCTVCHGGQGLATEVAAAHGDVHHWEEPLLRGPLVQASCAQCHGNVQEIAEHIPLLIKGQKLFKAKGCYGCHAVKDFGQTVSVDLTEVGSKSHLLIEADFEMMEEPHNRIHWLMRKLKNPRTLNPGVRSDELPAGEEEVFPSAMPHFGLVEADIEALTVYLLSLTAFDPPASYVIPPQPEPTPIYASPPEKGKAVFEKFGCAACHGIGGVGGRRNWNAGLGEEVPSLLYVKAYYGNDIESLKRLIREGRQPVPRANPTRPNPPLYMPAWKDRISEEELDALVVYLFSLADRLPTPSASTEPASKTN
jgi:mono/diheme cytochrome c family protein